MTICFFFSSRRRHTRYWRDWSSDVCSSDLAARLDARACSGRRSNQSTTSRTDRSASSTYAPTFTPPFRSEERRVGKSVDLGGRRIIKKKTIIVLTCQLHIIQSLHTLKCDTE